MRGHERVAPNLHTNGSCKLCINEKRKLRFFHSRAHNLGLEASQLAALWRQQRGLCALTGERLTRDNSELDHIIPKSRGGKHEMENLRWVTRVANQSKRDLLDIEFFELCMAVVAHTITLDKTKLDESREDLWDFVLNGREGVGRDEFEQVQ